MEGLVESFYGGGELLEDESLIEKALELAGLDPGLERAVTAKRASSIYTRMAGILQRVTRSGAPGGVPTSVEQRGTAVEVLRPDEPVQGLVTKEALTAAPERQGSFFKTAPPARE